MSNSYNASASRDAGLSKFCAQTYLKMGIGLFISFGVGLLMYKTLPLHILAATTNPILVTIAGIIQIVLVISLSSKAYKGHAKQAMWMFVLYSALNALTFVPIFAIYDAQLILQAFFVTGVTFVGMSAYGYTTKRNLSAWGNFLLGSLIGILIALLLNLFLQSSILSLFVSLVAVVIFAAYMAYDTQLMRKSYYATTDSSLLNGLSTFWALQLYMDIINMFIYVLRILGIFSSDDN